MPEKPLEYAANLLKRGRDLAKQQARILLLQGQIMRLRDEKERLFLRMGQKVYALFEKDLVKNADLLDLCRKARDIDQEIARREQEIEQVRAGQDEAAVDREQLVTEEPDTVASPSPPPPSWAPRAEEAADPGDAFLCGDQPPAEPGDAAAAPAAEATPGIDPTAEPRSPAGAPTPPAEPTPGAEPTAEPADPQEAPGAQPPARPPSSPA